MSGPPTYGLHSAIANVVEPLIQVQRPDNATLHRHVRGLVEPGDLDDAVLLRVAVAVLGHCDLHPETAHLLEAGGWTVGLAIPEIDEKLELGIRAVAKCSHVRSPGW